MRIDVFIQYIGIICSKKIRVIKNNFAEVKQNYCEAHTYFLYYFQHTVEY